MLKQIEGFIVQEIPYKETSKIINVLTKEYGIIGIICKGAKSIKNVNRALTTKYTYGFFNVYFKENKLSTLVSVDLINDLSNIKTDLTLLSYTTYITELITQVVKQGFYEEIYDIFIATVLKINNKLDPLILTNILEIKMLDYLGVSLNLNSCNKCGNKTNIVTIDGDVGGYVCKNCLTNEMIVKPSTIKMLRMYYYVDIKTISDLKISSTTKNEINNFLSRYYDRYTGLYLKSKNFLDQILKLA